MEFDIKILDEKYIDDIMQLQDEIIGSLSNKDLLRKNTREMMLSCLAAPNITYGAFKDGILAAVGILVDARGTNEYLGNDLETENVVSVANMKSILVREEYRGYGLQQLLMNRCEEEAIKRGFSHMCATISPDNIYSERNAVALGYKLDHTSVKYGGLVRNIFIKDISFEN